MPDGVPLREFIVSVIDEHEKRNVDRIRALERQVADLERLLEARMHSQAVAVEKSEAQYDARFASANEFRQAMQDLTRTFASKDSLEDQMVGVRRQFAELSEKLAASEKRLDARIGENDKRFANLNGKIVGYSAGVSFLFFIITLVILLNSLGA